MFRAIRFFLFETLMVIGMGACGIYHNLILYGLAQAQGQLHIIQHTREVADVMKDPTFPDSLKKKLLLIREIKQFAYDSLGLKPSDNYTTIYDQHGKAVLWTITASDPFCLKPKEWVFPLLGAVSYKGFFDYEKGKKEAAELVSKGYDVDYGGVGGWSTLGWFKDPILSNMLYRNEGQLASLLIHELTHGTIYRKSSVDYNENLANFVGDKGAQLFLQTKYGCDSPSFLEYVHSKSDRKVYNTYILKAAGRLDSLYRTFSQGGPVVEKELKKMNIIYETLSGVKSLQLYHLTSYMAYTRDAVEEKNAFFMSFRRYDSKYEEFEKNFSVNYHQNLRCFIQGQLKNN